MAHDAVGEGRRSESLPLVEGREPPSRLTVVIDSSLTIHGDYDTVANLPPYTPAAVTARDVAMW